MNRKLSRTDIIVLLFSSLIFVASGVLLYLEMMQTYEQGAGRPVGNVSYRNRSVQRRDMGQVVWQRILPGDTVYDGDSIRTGETAEAIIELQEGGKIELDPESLIVLRLREKVHLTVVRGSVIARSDANGMIVEHNGRQYTVESGPARFFVDPLNEKNLEIEAGEKASVLSEEGEVLLQADEALSIKDGEERRLQRRIRPTAPEDNARFFFSEDDMDMEFRWQGKAATLDLYRGTPAEENRQSFDVTGQSGLSLRLKAGDYYWRLRQGLELGPLRRLRLQVKDGPRLLVPGPDAKIRIAKETGYVAFRWEEDDSASSYFIELAKDRGFTDRVAYQSVQRTGLSVELPPGRYYWRVLSRGNVTGSESESAVFSFEVIGKDLDQTEEPEQEQTEQPEKKESVNIQKPVVQPLVLLYPSGVVDMTGKNALFFRWKGSPEVQRRLVLRDATGTVVFQTDVTGNAYTLTDLTVLDTGIFRWTLESPKERAQAKFTIVLHENLPPPELEIQ